MERPNAATPIRLALSADIHADEARRDLLLEAFKEIPDVDLVLLAGDLTTFGLPEQAEVLADACKELPVPAVAVLGNHDFQSDAADAVVEVLETAGVTVLDGQSVSFEVGGSIVGIAGTKGFVGGFPDWELPNFGEPLLREVYEATTTEVRKLERALDEIADCDLRVVMLHYSPTATTLAGEPEGIWSFLGSHRLGVPIARSTPDLVLHGHAHIGAPHGEIEQIPVLNVATELRGAVFTFAELQPAGLKLLSPSRVW